MPEVCGILLAAGRGRRFAPHGNKLLAPLPDGTAVGVAAARNMLGAVDALYAVIAPEEAALAEAFAAAGARLLINPAARRGMGTSLACGVAATADADGWVIGLADMPWIQATTIRAIVDALRQGATLVAPAYRGRRGHPVGFGSAFRQALLQLDGDSGARALLERHAAQLRLIELDDPGTLQDIDRPGDMICADSDGP